MILSKKNKKKENDIFAAPKRARWWLPLATVFFVLVLLFVGGYVGIHVAYAQKFYPGVHIGVIDVGGQTKAQALAELKRIEVGIQNNGLLFVGEGKKIGVSPISAATDPDLARQFITFNWDQTVNNAFAVGRSSNPLTALGQILSTVTRGVTVPAVVVMDSGEMANTLHASFASAEKPPHDAALHIAGDQVTIEGEVSGYVFNYEAAVATLRNNLALLKTDPVHLDLVFREPTIKKNDVSAALAIMPKLLAIKSLTLTASSTNFTVSQSLFRSWLEFQRQDAAFVVGASHDKVSDYLRTIADKIDVESHDITLKLDGERVVNFIPGQDGRQLDVTATYNRINDSVLTAATGTIPLAIEMTKSALNADSNAADLGITELIGSGTSNFAGSPPNRRHNIAVGAKALNGLLIKPGEEFSLIKALGQIDGDHGYLPELVIKGDRTLPEFGGGLCQIGTTTFRAALNSGLPITERRNHSYRVVYYEPAGMDATIYDPQPDLKFINDTGHAILFTTKIDGNILAFSFYGTKDGRKVVISPNPPKIYNIVKPAAPRYIETTDLKPGEKKRLESAHNGADTYFKYTVTYPNGDVKNQDFYSHYIPWQEVWSVGVAPSSTPAVVEPQPSATN